MDFEEIFIDDEEERRDEVKQMNSSLVLLLLLVVLLPLLLMLVLRWGLSGSIIFVYCDDMTIFNRKIDKPQQKKLEIFRDFFVDS